MLAARKPRLGSLFVATAAYLGAARADDRAGLRQPVRAPTPQSPVRSRVPGTPHPLTDVMQPLPSNVVTRLGPTGLWFAGATADNTPIEEREFFIYHVGADGARVVFREFAAPDLVQWSDAHTLWVVEAPRGAPLRARRFVRGAVTATWQLPRAALVAPDKGEASVLGMLGPARAPWVQLCVKFDRRGACVAARYWRLAESPEADLVISSRAPQRARPLPPPAFPEPRPQRAPHGVEVIRTSLLVDGQRIGGIRCTREGKAMTWPRTDTTNWQFAVRPRTVKWIAANPPLFSVTGIAETPIAERYVTTVTFRACDAEPFDRFVWLGANVWLYAVIHTENDQPGPVTHTTWHLMSDAEPLATMLASDGAFFPAPRNDQ